MSYKANRRSKGKEARYSLGDIFSGSFVFNPKTDHYFLVFVPERDLVVPKGG